MPDVEAHITGTVWKVECKVGQRGRGGRHARDPRVDEDGDARRGRGRRHRQRDRAAKRASPSPKATRSSCSSRPGARLRQADPGRARRGRRAADDPQPPAARRARPRDPRRARRDAARSSTPAASCITRHRHACSRAGYDLGNLEGREFEESAEKLVAHPFHEAIEALEAFAYPVIGAAQRARDRRRARAGDHVRHPHRRARHQARHAAREARPHLLAHRPAEVHRGLRRGQHHRAVLRRAQRRRRPGARDGPRQPGRRARRARGARCSSSRPRSRRTRRCRWPATSASCARCAHSRCRSDVERELIELRESCFRTEDFREGVRAFAEKRPPVWRGR